MKCNKCGKSLILLREMSNNDEWEGQIVGCPTQTGGHTCFRVCEETIRAGHKDAMKWIGERKS
jgi:hypothetical protein